MDKYLHDSAGVLSTNVAALVTVETVVNKVGLEILVVVVSIASLVTASFDVGTDDWVEVVDVSSVVTATISVTIPVCSDVAVVFGTWYAVDCPTDVELTDDAV